MASTKELRRRIKSIKSTSQITKAMQMVSATKMRKAQNQALSARPYNQTLLNILSQVSGKVKLEAHPLLSRGKSPKVGILILSTDKGLCGALNTNLFRLVHGSKFMTRGGETGDVMYYTIGKKARDFLARTGKYLHADFESLEHVNFRLAVPIRKMMVEAFLNGEVGEVYILYPHFVSTLRQEPRLMQVLPVKIQVPEVPEGPKVSQGISSAGEFLFEPNMDEVLEYALTHIIETQIYQALLETKASEHSARMMAMQNATDNAKELVNDLALTYNQLRQGAITTELLEITSAGAALE